MTEMQARTQRGFVVTGQVQGVGFRWWAARTARALDLAGTVCNCPDGSVEIHVAGAAEAVASLAALLEEGPPAARVHRVTPVPSNVMLPNDFRLIG